MLQVNEDKISTDDLELEKERYCEMNEIIDKLKEFTYRCTNKEAGMIKNDIELLLKNLIR